MVDNVQNRVLSVFAIMSQDELIMLEKMANLTEIKQGVKPDYDDLVRASVRAMYKAMEKAGEFNV